MPGAAKGMDLLLHPLVKTQRVTRWGRGRHKLMDGQGDRDKMTVAAGDDYVKTDVCLTETDGWSGLCCQRLKREGRRDG